MSYALIISFLIKKCSKLYLPEIFESFVDESHNEDANSFGIPSFEQDSGLVSRFEINLRVIKYNYIFI